ncbi:hypothetical protein WMY93_002355 [Mugilogobius chulae]|uniref:Uncharacterized protein n=1 Tax=Mugilogobius chulae TaxID=88201 RepID=A0AAW0Q4I6_9GOBI
MVECPVSNTQGPVSNIQGPVSNIQSPVSNIHGRVSSVQYPESRSAKEKDLGIGVLKIVWRIFNKILETSAYQTHVVNVNGASLRFEIWDTAGQEKYHSVTPLYYRGAHAALVVYDISKRERVNSTDKGRDICSSSVLAEGAGETVIPGSTVVWLVGNKADLEERRQVSAQEAQNLAEDRGLGFMETSALSGDHVNQLLLTVAYRVHELTWDQRSLSEWQEFHNVDPQNRGFFSHLPSCCNVGP